MADVVAQADTVSWELHAAGHGSGEEVSVELDTGQLTSTQVGTLRAAALHVHRSISHRLARISLSARIIEHWEVQTLHVIA